MTAVPVVKPNVFVSRCLGFGRCRWNGEELSDAFVESLKPFVNIITTCPEYEIGLGVPRDPIRIVLTGGKRRLAQLGTERDVTAEIARQMRLLNHPALTTSLERVWGVARTDSGDRSADIERYRAVVQRTGGARSDASRGRAVYDRVCAACHTLFGDGGQIGPDITGSNRGNLDYLLHNILDPNAEIPNAYRATTVTLRDGRVLSGVVGVQDAKVVTVVTTNETVTVPRADIATLAQSDVSMMPEGLLEPLNDQEVRDLVAYLRGSRQVARPR